MRMDQTPRTHTGKYNNSTERFLCAAPLKARQRRCRPPAQWVWSKLLRKFCTSASRGCVRWTPGRSNPAAAQPQGEYRATLQPHGHGRPRSAGKDIPPHSLQQGEEAASGCSPSILQAPRHIWRTEYSDVVASRVTQAVLRPAEREPGIQLWRTAWPGCPHSKAPCPGLAPPPPGVHGHGQP